MPEVHHVKKARKANKDQGIKKGDSYYWWKFRRGGVRTSKTYPRPSQLTQSEFWSAFHGITESAEDNTPVAGDLGSERDGIIADLEELKNETQSKFDNMPDGLQQGDTGQMLENRVSELENLISELESVSTDLDIEKEPEETEEEWVQRQAERASEIWAEVVEHLTGFSCD